jgi:predicted nucleic acid-binding protein
VSNLSAITNASPLIYLGKIGALDLLKRQFTEILTTDVVKEEILAQTDAPEHLALIDAFNSFLRIHNFSNQRFYQNVIKMPLHPGEASVIALARELNINKNSAPILILDDLSARNICTSLNIRFTGTIGILLHAAKHQQISVLECKTFFKNLCENTSFRMETKLYSRILTDIEKLE